MPSESRAFNDPGDCDIQNEYSTAAFESDKEPHSITKRLNFCGFPTPQAFDRHGLLNTTRLRYSNLQGIH
jgi:hypothetical protein